jgi:Spy/CpxP family protein refolding chaperone
MNRLCITWMLLIAAAGAQILPTGPGSRWWKSPQMVERLGLTPEQQKKMDDVFQQGRLRLIDLTASLDKEEAILEPLVAAGQPDAEKIRAQINRVAEARSELEKANANMLLGLRLLLTQDQWKAIQAGASGPRARRMANGPEGSPPTPKKQR